jgi:DNA modification methylase
VIVARGWSEDEKRAYRIADNQHARNSTWNEGFLRSEMVDLKAHGFDLKYTAFDGVKVGDFLRGAGLGQAGQQRQGGTGVTLAERFGVPPFTILDARQGYWQDRKRAWLALGIQSELGRGDGADAAGRTWGQDLMRREHVVGVPSAPVAQTSGTSIFDPVLCEMAYRWFCPPRGSVFDPFAGGSVRGIVAMMLDRAYTGMDLNARQLEANRAQALGLQSQSFTRVPMWMAGDSRSQLAAARQAGQGENFDFVFSCPPYADLEKYSDDPRDLSNMDYAGFTAAYYDIIRDTVLMLKPDRFACWVVSDVRDRAGMYYGLVGHTVAAFEDAGAKLYNDAVLVTAVGSMPQRLRRQFEGARKLGKTHQNVLVFVKGDPKVATEAIGDVEFALPEEEQQPTA